MGADGRQDDRQPAAPRSATPLPRPHRVRRVSRGPVGRRHRLAGAARSATRRVRQTGQLVARILSRVADARPPRWPSTPSPTSRGNGCTTTAAPTGCATSNTSTTNRGTSNHRRSRPAAGSPPSLPALTVWDLPGDDIPPPTDPPPATGVFTVNGYRSEVRQGSTGRMAKMCQQQINLIVRPGRRRGRQLRQPVRRRPQERAGRARRRRRRRLRHRRRGRRSRTGSNSRPKQETGTDARRTRPRRRRPRPARHLPRRTDLVT